MDFKELSPAFLTSLATIFVGAILAGTGLTLVTVLGWLLILGGIGLNVFAALVSIQQAKGAPLPFLIASHEDHGESPRESAEVQEVELNEDPEPDTESQPIVVTDKTEEKDSSIFRTVRRKPVGSRS
ncbi:hypothetical protein [Rothia sp. ZJ932]|uniref:hypothetical protein n=1 Tax=Rothia sp. ZJ932 TaxID=2810516 RepID=UPI001967B0B6|nr:hypothetical protein [Rothia sp. ZJ932]QRZ61608.1 hypothetical protein JR346_00175 [Rothia sp. ZJ932]